MEKKYIVTLYAAFKRGDQFSYLFPWADGGSLEQLWCQKRTWMFTPQGVRESVRWIAKQCCGLVGPEGLLFIHDVKNGVINGKKLQLETHDHYGIHGDIKPGNILYFSQEDGQGSRGVIKISDLGHTRFHTEESRSNQPLGPCSQTYRAPEHSLDNDFEEFLTRKYDIWSLGCVFSELLTWFIMGPNGVYNYNWKRYNDPDDRLDDWKDDKFFKEWRYKKTKVGRVINSIEHLVRKDKGTKAPKVPKVRRVETRPSVIKVRETWGPPLFILQVMDTYTKSDSG
jgi:serine/threonine protein kinase